MRLHALFFVFFIFAMASAAKADEPKVRELFSDGTWRVVATELGPVRGCAFDAKVGSTEVVFYAGSAENTVGVYGHRFSKRTKNFSANLALPFFRQDLKFNIHATDGSHSLAQIADEEFDNIVTGIDALRARAEPLIVTFED